MPSVTQIALGVIGALVLVICFLAYFYKSEVRTNIQIQQQSETRQVQEAGNLAGEKVYDEYSDEEARKAQAVQDAWTAAKPTHDDLVDPDLLRVLEASGLYQSSGEPEVSGGSEKAGAPDWRRINQ